MYRFYFSPISSVSIVFYHAQNAAREQIYITNLFPFSWNMYYENYYKSQWNEKYFILEKIKTSNKSSKYFNRVDVPFFKRKTGEIFNPLGSSFHPPVPRLARCRNSNQNILNDAYMSCMTNWRGALSIYSRTWLSRLAENSPRCYVRLRHF